MLLSKSASVRLKPARPSQRTGPAAASAAQVASETSLESKCIPGSLQYETLSTYSIYTLEGAFSEHSAVKLPSNELLMRSPWHQTSRVCAVGRALTEREGIKQVRWCQAGNIRALRDNTNNIRTTLCILIHVLQ